MAEAGRGGARQVCARSSEPRSPRGRGAGALRLARDGAAYRELEGGDGQGRAGRGRGGPSRVCRAFAFFSKKDFRGEGIKSLGQEG